MNDKSKPTTAKGRGKTVQREDVESKSDRDKILDDLEARMTSLESAMKPLSPVAGFSPLLSVLSPPPPAHYELLDLSSPTELAPTPKSVSYQTIPLPLKPFPLTARPETMGQIKPYPDYSPSPRYQPSLKPISNPNYRNPINSRPLQSYQSNYSQERTQLLESYSRPVVGNKQSGINQPPGSYYSTNYDPTYLTESVITIPLSFDTTEATTHPCFPTSNSFQLSNYEPAPSPLNRFDGFDHGPPPTPPGTQSMIGADARMYDGRAIVGNTFSSKRRRE